ncbi:hypothetical protein PINS_up002561 [Pythium insidiosum]|nr:hypothetical protein PINS_up002561 [Pythium insidiosum]
MELADWFVDAECRLMRLRLQLFAPINMHRLLDTLGFRYQAYDHNELRQHLSADQTEWMRQVEGADANWYRVPFELAARQIARRRSLVSRGQCWIPGTALVDVVITHYRSALHEAILSLHRSLPAKRRDLERLAPVLKTLHRHAQRRIDDRGAQATAGQSAGAHT